MLKSTEKISLMKGHGDIKTVDTLSKHMTGNIAVNIALAIPATMFIAWTIALWKIWDYDIEAWWHSSDNDI